MAQDGTTVLPQSMIDFVVHGNIWDLWDAAEYNTGSDVEKFKKACSFKAGKMFGTTNKCENVIFCLYNVSDKFIVPLGILKSISVEKKGTNEIFTLAFTELPELKSFDNLEIKISKTNLSRIKYMYLDGNVEKRQSMLTKVKDSLKREKPIAAEVDQASSEQQDVEQINKKSTISRIGDTFGNIGTKMKNFVNTKPVAGHGQGGGKRKTAHKSKNKKRKFSLRKK